MKIINILSLIIAGSILVAGCSKDKDSVNDSANRQLEVRLTDAPFDATQVNVEITRVQVHVNDDPNGGWYDLPTLAGVHNLLALQNGVDIAIANGPVPAPVVNELRLVLGNNNTIMIDGVLLPLTVPSGSESGLKIKLNKTLVDPVTTVIIDFDAGLSVHKTGNDKYILRPVLKLK